MSDVYVGYGCWLRWDGNGGVGERWKWGCLGMRARDISSCDLMATGPLVLVRAIDLGHWEEAVVESEV